MSSSVRTPLTILEKERRAAVWELERRAAVLKASSSNHDTAYASDVHQFGERGAGIIRDCKRDVASAPLESRLSAFEAAAKTLSAAVADQWLSKAIVADRLQEIAENHNGLGKSADEIQQIISNAMTMIDVPRIESPAKVLKRRLIAYRASDLEPEKLAWVWQGRIAEGKLVLLGGPPGLGKSQLTAFMAATVSNGGYWPCGEGSTMPGDVIILSAEDGVQDTIIPRLMAAGAKRERVYIVSAATKPDGTGRKTFSLKTDVDLLEELVRRIGTVRLIIVDPISAYMGGSDGNGNVETREVLEPLADMANRLHVAVVAVTHLNKGGGGGNQSALNRFAGSIAFVAAARAAFAVLEDPEDDQRRFLLQAKNNLGKKCEGLAFRIEQRLVGDDDVMSSNVMFEGDHVSESIDEALSASENRGGQNGQSGGSKEDVMQFLKAVLSGGPMDVLEVEREARAAALLEEGKRLNKSKVFRDARDALSVKTTREGFGPGSKFVLSLPGSLSAPIGAIGAPSETGASMENKGANGVVGGAT